MEELNRIISTNHKKINILVVFSDVTGVGYFRSINPHLALEKYYTDDFHIDVDGHPKFDDDEYLKKYDIIHYHRTFGPYEKMAETNERLRRLGIISIMDLDDYWSPGPHHPAYILIKESGLDKKIMENVKMAQYVSTTTSVAAAEIKKLNPNVIVIPNAIDPTEKQYVPNPEPNTSGRVRFGYLAGSSHLKDLEILNGVVNKLKSEGLMDKIQFVLCGFDTRGTMTSVNEETKEQQARKILPHESVWCNYERIFTDNYSTVSPEYKAHLLKYNKDEYPDVDKEPYRRVWTKPITTYATNYNLFDVSLAPIEENIFNAFKCIVGDSMISTNKGFMAISDIVADKRKVKTELNGKQNNVINYFKYENAKTIKIITEDGYEIEGTPHHKIFINNDWVQLDSLKIGDGIELTKPEFLQKAYQEITYPMLLTKNITQEKIDNADEDMLPRIRINESWGRLLGYMLGDGTYGAHLIGISCDRRHTNVVDDVISLLRSIGLNPTVYNKKPDKRCINSLAKEGFAVDIKSTCINFVSISKKYGWCGSHGKTFSVPKVILESPKSVIREFLRGLFEADGTVSKQGIVDFCSKDLKLIKQLQVILLGFNIQCNVIYTYNKHYRKYYYRINLRREGSENFLREIGFVSKHKQDRLNKLKDSKRSNNFIPQTMHDKIKTIEFTTNTVYDIEVDDVHSYNANGIKNHNSQLKIEEAGFHKKALIAQDFGPYKIDLVNAVEYGGTINPKGNALTVETLKNHKMWYQHIKRLVQNPELITMLAENLYNTVKDVYSIEAVSKLRHDIYIKLLEK